MKRILLAAVILLVAGMMVYAQQAATQGTSRPSSSQIKQTAQQYLTQAKSNSSQFESTLNDLDARNVSNKDAETFNRLKNEIDRLENMINTEQARIGGNLEGGQRLDSELLNRIQRLIDQHKAKLAELEAFIGG